jgi:hypothetical protein
MCLQSEYQPCQECFGKITINAFFVFRLPGLQLRQYHLPHGMLKVAKSADLPSFDMFPLAHRITYKYYLGALAFLNENYKKVSFFSFVRYSIHQVLTFGRLLTFRSSTFIPTR